MSYDQSKIVDTLRAFERGEMVVVTDDDDRENEGDLIVAAVHCTPEMMALMVRHTSGIICAPMTAEDANRLNLQPMVAENTDAKGTAFTVSVDYKHGTTTGISADDRTATVRNLANNNAGATDFNRPGHIFPLVAREGGVLMRSGHTEAAVDLCKLAGLPPVGVISELVNDDGSVMRGPQVAAFAEAHGFRQISVADLIAYRQRQESLVARAETTQIDTPAGPASATAFTLQWDPMQHLAIVVGDIRDGHEIPVRLHLENVLDDVFGVENSPMDILKSMVETHGRGVVIYLREGSVGVARGSGRPTGSETHVQARDRETEWREIGLGAQILRDLGISSIRLYASRERRYIGLEGFGIEITTTEASG
jgi:3,4-dihydroxy 2-butanone 4-phosphate synthase/GTP cyclohydrolase II